MALVAILILFILLALCLWRTSGNRTVYVRDREPLPPRTKLRSRPPSMSSLYTSSDRKNGSMIDMQPMPMPYYSSTTALYDSTERLNRLNEQYGSYRSGSGHKVPLDVSQDWDGYFKTYSRDRDSGLYDDEKLDYSDSEPGTPYQTFKREQYFTDTHL
ncbi:laminin subunit [Porites harrisoni]